MNKTHDEDEEMNHWMCPEMYHWVWLSVSLFWWWGEGFVKVIYFSLHLSACDVSFLWCIYWCQRCDEFNADFNDIKAWFFCMIFELLVGRQWRRTGEQKLPRRSKMRWDFIYFLYFFLHISTFHFLCSLILIYSFYIFLHLIFDIVS